MNHNIVVRLDAPVRRSYTIRIQSGILDDLPDTIAREWRGKDVFIITDSNVRRLYGTRLLRALSSRNISSCLLDFPAGEQSKNAEVVRRLHTQLLAQGIRRDSLIVALGGGVVGDVAGFAAATVLRGVKYIQVPTTLLAQVDSSVGGKVGIDHPLGKNLIGAFHQPSGVYIDPRTLHSLTAADFRNGLAEVVKIAAALDRKFFEQIERTSRRITKNGLRLLSDIIARSVALKVAVVEKDEFESGLRKTLNLGHTLGHAIEASMNYTLKHGEAVAIGLVAESRIAVNMGLLKEQDHMRLRNTLRRLKLQTTFPKIKSRSRFFAALAADKKSDAGGTKFVLLKGLGYSVIGVQVPTPFVAQACGFPIV
jgi:3-dehydroquinate synthase